MTATAIKLYEATDAIEIVREWIEEHDEELRANEGVFPPQLAELLALVEGDFDAKAERVALFVRELLATGKAIKEEEERLRNRRKTFEGAADRLKRYLEMNMLEAQRMRIEGKLVTLRIQKNPPSVTHVLTADDLRALYVNTEGTLVRLIPEQYQLDARAVIERYKAGSVIPPGISVEQGASLRIA